MTRLSAWLAHPLTRGLDLDDPRTTQLRRQIICEKGFLRRIYQEWYSDIVAALPGGDGAVLELGSGAGFLSEVLPEVITSDILPCDNLAAVLDGQRLPLATGALRSLVMVNVLHHIPEPRRFLVAAARCVRPNGAVVMLEPWVTTWSRCVYTRLHHEPFDPESTDWGFPPDGPLSSANGALSWIIFERDRMCFEREFPEWEIESIRLKMPFRYLVSGGISLRNLMPQLAFGLWRSIEHGFHPWLKTWAMFAQIKLVRA